MNESSIQQGQKSSNQSCLHSPSYLPLLLSLAFSAPTISLLSFHAKATPPTEVLISVEQVSTYLIPLCAIFSQCCLPPCYTHNEYRYGLTPSLGHQPSPLRNNAPTPATCCCSTDLLPCLHVLLSSVKDEAPCSQGLRQYIHTSSLPLFLAPPSFMIHHFHQAHLLYAIPSSCLVLTLLASLLF